MMRLSLILTVFLVSPWTVQAAQHAMDALESSAAAGPVAEQPLTEGEVRRVNKESGRLTIKHGEIRNLDMPPMPPMPPMTMNFHVADAAMLDMVQAGDKIRFAVERVEGKYTVTRLEPARQSSQ